FSTFVVMHPNALNPDGFIPATIAGGPGAITDCRAEWELVNPNNFPFRDRHGRVNGLQNCRDGDPSCDADRTADGTCTFRLGICFNYPDSFLPLCTVDPILSYQLTKPKPLSRDALTINNANNL